VDNNVPYLFCNSFYARACIGRRQKGAELLAGNTFFRTEGEKKCYNTLQVLSVQRFDWPKRDLGRRAYKRVNAQKI
jgi:hypothetical protein